MVLAQILVLASTLALAWLVSLVISRSRRRIPPGPFSWPIFGSLFSLKMPLHRHFRLLAQKYGPLVYLKVGMSRLLVVNSSAMAKEVLKTHDSEFAYRPPSNPFKIFSFGYQDMVFAPPNNAWKKLRKLSAAHMFSPTMVNSTSAYGECAIKSIVSSIKKDGESVDLRKIIGEFGCDITMNLLFGGDFPEARRLVELIEKCGNMTLTLNIGDLFPALDRFDFHGINRTFESLLVPELTTILKKVLQEQKHNNKQSALSSLLQLKGDDALPEAAIMSLMMDMMAAGINTTQTAVEWAMAELMNSPRVLIKLCQELDSVVGTTRLLRDKDLVQLPYLQAVVKEILRLHPSASLGIPHYNVQPLKIGSYEIPANCKVFINIWAIQRDPAYWKQPEEFLPERFIESDMNVVGQQLDFMPFSAGMRICVGYPLAMRSIPLLVGSLVHAFQWKRHGEAKMVEDGFAIPSKMTSKLLAQAIPRLDKSAYLCG